eukprot:gene5660-7816_t
MQFILCLLSLSFVLTLSYDSNFDLNKAERYVSFCGAAYCADPIFVKNSINDWSCQACKSYPNVKATVFHGNITDANGFVAYDADANEIIVSFSGTDPLSIQNWLDDLNFIQTDYPYCTDCKVHKGFYQSYLSASSAVLSLVKQYQASYPSATLSVTGHSLGAAMAAHCMADLVHNGFKVTTVYSYGMPRVGNEAFEQWYVNTVVGTFRVVHEKDPVPHLPPENWNFHHMPYEVFYTKNNYENWKLCSFEGEDKTCSDQYWLDLNVLYHLNYLDFDFTTNYLSCQV